MAESSYLESQKPPGTGEMKQLDVPGSPNDIRNTKPPIERLSCDLTVMKDGHPDPPNKTLQYLDPYVAVRHSIQAVSSRPLPMAPDRRLDERYNKELSDPHFGQTPQRIPPPHTVKRRIPLTYGHLVLDLPVPSTLLDMCPLKTEREFQVMRYTAVTCDPDDFRAEGFSLRQVTDEPARMTELFICVTMYNEEEDLLCRTINGIIKNIQYLSTRERSKTWGKEAWKKVVVCIVSDGRKKINARTLSVLTAIGAYQDGWGKNMVNQKPVTAHLYEYTSQIPIGPAVRIGPQKESVPVQIIFCLKERNQRKINSHRWFFNAFGPVLEPNVCVLLDVGTMPAPTSIYHRWKSFDVNPNQGGACGELKVLKGKRGINLLQPLVAAQNFEYKMSDILERQTESVFGYITVLPGAFSAYRYIALQNDHKGNGPLRTYFLGEKIHGAGADLFTANLYLAEDRILCWELVSKRGGKWVLHYVKSAYAETDVPDHVSELLAQRRRWVNGTLFSTVHSIVKFHYIFRSSHTILRKLWLFIELLYRIFCVVFTWFALGNYYISFAIFANSMEDPSYNLTGIETFNAILNYTYIGLIVMCYILALGNRPQGSKWGYIVSFAGFALITVYMTFAAIYLAVKGIEDMNQQGITIWSTNFSDFVDNAFRKNIIGELLLTVAVYVLASLFSLSPWHLVTSLLQYFLMNPSYITVLTIYAFANIHDTSWGTKGESKVFTDLGAAIVTGTDRIDLEILPYDPNKQYKDALAVFSTKPSKAGNHRDASTKEDDYYKNFRTNVLLAWTLSNLILASVIMNMVYRANEASAQRGLNGYLWFILGSVAGIAFFRLIFSGLYMLIRRFSRE